jgi:threonine dehydrogenase-like Zn-dependent dehydrogenase
LVAWLLSGIPGCVVELVDVKLARECIAEALGFGFAQPAEASPDADLVLHCSGTAGGLTTALGLAGFEARVVELSWYGEKEVALPLGAAFHARRLQLVSSQVANVATSQRARWDHKRRMALTLRLLGDPVLDCLITGEDRFEDLPGVMARLSTDPGASLLHRIRFD